MVRDEIMPHACDTIPLSSIGLEPLATIRSHLHLLTLSIEVGQLRKVLRVVKANRDLIIKFLFFVAAIHRLSLAILWARLLALGAIHESTQRVILQFYVAGEQTLRFTHLDVVQEAVHDGAEGLRVNLCLLSFRIYASLKQIIRLILVVHHHQHLIRQLFLWGRLGYQELDGAISLESTIRLRIVFYPAVYVLRTKHLLILGCRCDTTLRLVVLHGGCCRCAFQFFHLNVVVALIVA